MRQRENIKIGVEDVRFILGGDFFRYWYWTINNVECKHCREGHTSILTDYIIELDFQNDFILNGKCQKCGSPIKRFLLAESNTNLAKRADVVRVLKKI